MNEAEGRLLSAIEIFLSILTGGSFHLWWAEEINMVHPVIWCL